MVTNNFIRSDLYGIHNIVQNSMTLYPKELVIATLRDFFAKDSWYSYRFDQWGFPQTPDHTDMSLQAGLEDSITTRLFIGESYRFDVIYYPAIIVRNAGMTSVPVSLNRETSCVQWKQVQVIDGYNVKQYAVPESFIFAGAWEGSISIDVMARDLRARDELVDMVSLLFVDIAYNDLVKSGLAIKGVSSSAPTQVLDRNDQLFTQTITLTVRSEWRREIPIENVIDVINFSIEFGQVPNGPIAPNLTINTRESISEILMNL
jgi:hypothetical protein